MAEPGIHAVHRSMFITGAMAYLSAPLWLAFLTLGTALWLSGAKLVADWHILPAELLSLWAWTLCMLFLPRILGVAAVFMRREQRNTAVPSACSRAPRWRVCWPSCRPPSACWRIRCSC